MTKMGAKQPAIPAQFVTIRPPKLLGGVFWDGETGRRGERVIRLELGFPMCDLLLLLKWGKWKRGGVAARLGWSYRMCDWLQWAILPERKGYFPPVPQSPRPPVLEAP